MLTVCCVRLCSASANTKKVALNALVFLYKQMLGLELGKMRFSLSRKQCQLPVVLTKDEVKAVLIT